MLFGKLFMCLCLSVVCLSVYNCCSIPAPLSICNATRPANKPYRLFSITTTYTEALKAMDLKTIEKVNHDNCKPLMFYYFARHAARYPSQSEIIKMKQVLKNYRRKLDQLMSKTSDLCPNELEALRNWRLNMMEYDGEKISFTGQKETKEIGLDHLNKDNFRRSDH